MKKTLTNFEIQAAVVKKVHELVDFFNKKLNKNVEYPGVKFSVTKSRTAGHSVYDAITKEWYVEFNMHFFKDHFDEMMNDTVPHEVSHYLADIHSKKSAGHGKAWKMMMMFFGVEPSRCHNMAIPETIKANLFLYKCNCMEHYITKTRHNKILRGFKYSCAKCGSGLEKVK